ncbi:LexA family transcriptional regulator [Mesorhizobium neociceri]|uniref:Helix-turn-helix domain-containing protein n=1 Tax=Mesorhizobium neociceri TaxID=1307853 RepID=A0A838B6N4_9HYPH|nr:LexA family transcriptional regulator [Mesorhizobium neociceri]MBA1141737.1 helix-turn-helix domain-containing protein [Mesorhizobium neociceri]
MDNSYMQNDLQKIVVRRLDELGLGPVEAATKAGLERTYIRDIVQGKKLSVRTDKLESLARALQLDPGDLSLSKATASPLTALRNVPVTGFVQAGHWAETWEWSDDDVYTEGVPDDPAWRSFTLHAAEVRGPSMNRRYPENTVLVFTDLIETGAALEPGRRYIVERERADGLREATVKKLWRDDAGKIWLLPESDDPRFQEPIPIDGGEDDTVRIVGRVVYAVSRE